MVTWKFRFRTMIQLKTEAPSGLYGATLKVFCMLLQLMLLQNYNSWQLTRDTPGTFERQALTSGAQRWVEA
jgi:hypothetical protein